MPKKREKELINEKYFRWLLGRRNGVYVADGRSNNVDTGRHSLGTRDRAEALRALAQLDRVQAVKFGLAPVETTSNSSLARVSLERGRDLYLQYVSRSRVVGGAKPATAKRYRPVFEKFFDFARKKNIVEWNQVTRGLLQEYAGWLDRREYGYATQYLELTTLKMTMKWLADEGYLPPTCLFTLRLDKPLETTTYCWRAVEVEAMLLHCNSRPELTWVGDVIVGLSRTGLRISELRSLRWADIDTDLNVITLPDETRRAPSRGAGTGRQTKSGRSRSFPIHADLANVLERIPRATDGYIFHGARGARLKPDRIRRVLIRDVLGPLAERFPTGEGEVGFADGRLHSFRHFFCSMCANSGVPERMVMAWLGHRDSRMVHRYYHLHDREAQQQMERLSFSDAADRVVSGGSS